MKLVMTLLVSDEHDILEANLDFHLGQGVDFVIVTSDRGGPASIAATLQRYVERGVCHVIEDDPGRYLQGEWITRMARMAATDFGADWVINADVDEFYWPQTGTLKGIFSAVPDELGKLMLPVSHFVPRPGEGFFADRMTVRETLSLKSGVGPGAQGRLTKVAHRGAADVEVSRGGHRAYGTGLDPLLGWEPITGFHFPVRSFAQFESKVTRDGRTADLKIRALRQDLFEQHAAGRLLDLYEQRVVEDAEARSGIEEGRLVVDERLKRFFGGVECAAPGEPTADEVHSLQTEMERAVKEHEHDPLTTEIRHLQDLLALTEGRLAKFTKALARAKTSRTEADARSARLQEERDAARRKLKAEQKETKSLRAELAKTRRWRRLPGFVRDVVSRRRAIHGSGRRRERRL
jgi:hypothetical protein